MLIRFDRDKYQVVLSQEVRMGCGCAKKNIMPRTANLRPTVGPRPVVGGLSAGANPAEIRALGMQSNVGIGETRRLDEQRLRLEKLRRQAIAKKLNK
jgi:hypothetical protein